MPRVSGPRICRLRADLAPGFCLALFLSGTMLGVGLAPVAAQPALAEPASAPLATEQAAKAPTAAKTAEANTAAEQTATKRQAGESPAPTSPAERPRRLLLIGQKADGVHPHGTHEHLAAMRILAHLLRETPGLKTELVAADDAWEEGPNLIRQADGVVLYVSEGGKWIAADPRRGDALAQVAARRGGLTALHWAMGVKDPAPIEQVVKLFGACHGGPDRKYQVLDKPTLRIKLADHPLTQGLTDFTVPKEEFYYRLKTFKGETAIQPVIQVAIDGAEETVSWAWERPDGGRSFGFSGLHFHANWESPAVRRLIAQAVLWTMREAIPAGGLPVEIDAETLILPPAAPPASDSPAPK